MADTKISALPASTTPLAGTEVLPIVQSGVTKKTSIESVLTSVQPSGTANGVAYLNGSKVLTTGSALVFDGSNLGLGVTPSSSTTDYKLLEIGGGGNSLAGWNNDSVSILALTSNAYRDGSTWNYKVTNENALQFVTHAKDGNFGWLTAGTGTAGNAITFTQVMTLNASGTLGIGITTPTSGYKLHVAGDLRVSNSGSETGALQISQESTQALIQTRYAQPLVFGTSVTERARITSGGDLLVGTTVAKAGARATFEYDTAPQIAVNRLGTDGAAIVMLKAGTTVGTISVTGSATAYNTSSDYRLKNITGPITTSGAYIDSLKPVEGTWKADGSTFVGLIAHEVQEASRTSVATGIKDGEQMQSMDYSSAEIIANLIAEVKALRTRVAQLESN